MNKIKTTAAAGVALAATAGLVAGPAMMASSAWAATEGATGSFQINSNDNNADFKYEGVQIFKADIRDVDGKKVATNLEWADDTVKTTVEGVLTTAGITVPAGATAQDVADLVIENWGEEVPADDDTLRLPYETLGMKIAAAVKAAGTTKTAEFGPDEAQTIAQGYWVFFSTQGNDTDEYSMAPVFAAVGGSDVAVDEKATLPTVSKYVLEDSTATPANADAALALAAASWGTEADHTVGQDVWYKVVGTVSDNIVSFDEYSYKFVDTLPAAMQKTASSVKIMWGDKDITDEFTIDTTTNVTAACDDLTAIEGFEDLIEEDIVMVYKAHQDATDAAEAGATNEVYVEYSNDPFATGEGTVAKTSTDEATDYSYGLKLDKIDNANKATITSSEAVFTIKNAAGTYIGLVDGTGAELKDADDNAVQIDVEGNMVDVYQVADDSKVCEQAEPFYFATTDGILDIRGIDADTYTVTEVKAPEQYNKLEAPIEVDVTAETVDKDGTAVREVTRDVAVDTNTNKSEYDATAGAVKIPNVKDLNLPITGEQGIALLLLAGGAIIVGSSIGIVRSRKNSQEA